LEHPANKQQREIVCYFKKTHEFLGVAEGTQQQTPDSSWGLRDINAALKIVQKSLDVSRNLVVPSLCENYHVLVIATLQYIKKYHETRVLLDENKIEESALREVRLEQLKLAAKQSKEFYKIIREAGFIRFW
jgi:hypothetical protein